MPFVPRHDIIAKPLGLNSSLNLPWNQFNFLRAHNQLCHTRTFHFTLAQRFTEHSPCTFSFWKNLYQWNQSKMHSNFCSGVAQQIWLTSNFGPITDAPPQFIPCFWRHWVKISLDGLVSSVLPISQVAPSGDGVCHFFLDLSGRAIPWMGHKSFVCLSLGLDMTAIHLVDQRSIGGLHSSRAAGEVSSTKSAHPGRSSPLP